MKLGTETGSLVNHMLSGSASEPSLGMGATVLYWTDRKAGTIVRVTPHTFTDQLDRVTRTDRNGMSEDQTYDCQPDPDGATYVFRRTKRGWRSSGVGVLIGQRRHYHDYSF